MNNQDHKPVLIDKIIQFLKGDEDKQEDSVQKKFLDLTFGAGGYSKRLGQEFQDAEIFCFDQDPLVKKYFENLKANLKNKLHFFQSNFSDAKEVLLENGIEEGFFNGIFFDLGVSSMQLDDKKRGFSFYGEDNKLDMRMNPNDETNSFSAYEFVNYASEKEIADIIYYYGEEREARKIARNIVKTREEIGEIKTSKELADLILKIIPYRKNNLKVSIHPATKTFQAIRIHINKEFDHLVLALQKIVRFLKPGGKMFVVSFHSLEDRIVKNFFSYMEKSFDFDLELKKHFKIAFQDEKSFFQNYKFSSFKKIIEPDHSEIKENIRSRSAKMRVLRRDF